MRACSLHRVSSLVAPAFALALAACAPRAPSRAGPAAVAPSTTPAVASSVSRAPSPDAGAAPAAPCPDVQVARPESEPDTGSAEPASFDDGVELPHDPAASAAPLPFADMTDDAITAKLRADLAALGPMSIGHAHSGVLVSGVQMPEGANWQIVSPSLAWGTKETVDALAHAFDAVAAKFPETPKAFVGDISGKRGGHLPPHVSHQSGRDVDLGYYLVPGHHKWYATATEQTLDRARTWHLVRTLIAESDIDIILVDHRVQRLLRDHALSIGEDRAWVDDLFQVSGKSRRPIFVHAPGHATHLHVRFYSPAARELGRRAYKLLASRRLIAPPTTFITHTVKPGETLSHLAVRYKVSVAAIKKANGLTKDVLRVKRAYKIPQVGGIARPAPLALPARRVPPAPVVVVATKSDVAPCGLP